LIVLQFNETTKQDRRVDIFSETIARVEFCACMWERVLGRTRTRATKILEMTLVHFIRCRYPSS
jgi:hypothetical protein